MSGVATRGSRVVFVGNIPYDMSEEQLIAVFAEVGKVVGFRLVFDRNTGKAKGYGFCEFEDAETAASAVRNLNDVDVGGRCLRIDRAEEDPLFEGRTTQMGQMDEVLPPRGARGPRAFGPGARGGFGGAPPGVTDGGWGNRGGPGGPGAAPAQLPPNLPPGQSLPPGADPTDAISQTLASLPPGKLLDVMAQMKALVTNAPDQARTLLTGNPQVAYALFQAMLMMNVVDPAILQRIIGAQAGAGSAPAPPPQQPPVPMPPQQAPQYGGGPPQGYGGPPQGYGAPMHGQAPGPPPPPPPPAAAPALGQANLPEDQRALLMQVLQLTPEQINALPESQRQGVLALKAQMGQ